MTTKKLVEFTQDEIQSRITAMKNSNYDRVLKFLNNDHWQDQWGWVGPLALESDGTTSEAGMLTIEAKFAFYNAVLEIVMRMASGILGETPHWQITPERVLNAKPKRKEPAKITTAQPLAQPAQPAKPAPEAADPSQPTPEETKVIDEAESALTVWMDKKLKRFNEDFDPNNSLTLFDPLTRFLINLASFGRGVLRIFIPAAMDGKVSATTLKDALDLIYFSAPDITQAGVLTDKNRQEQLGAYLYTDVETSYLETTWVRDGITFLKTVINDVESETKIGMRGHMFIFEARCKPLVSDAIISLQKQLNMSLTMLGRNVVVSGSPALFFFNALFPGRTQIVDGVSKYVADPVPTGAGTVLSVTGVPQKNAMTGEETYTNPSAFQPAPAPVDTFTATDDHYYRLILGQAQQLHALLSGDAAASGESRIQALSDFENSLKLIANCANSAIQWLLESALSLASAIMGKDGIYDEYRATVQCNTKAGAVSTEMLRTLDELVRDNFLSHETGLAWAMVKDVEAEQARIEMQKSKDMAERQEMGATQLNGVTDTLTQLRNKATNGNGNGSNGKVAVKNGSRN